MGSEMSSADDHNDPPKLSKIIPRVQDLPDANKPWQNSPLPVEVLLITVKDLEFLSCFVFMKDQFYSHNRDLGRVYFGVIGDENVRVALLKCDEGSAGPGGALSKTKSAITILRPKVVFCVGCCGGLSEKKTKLGDVVISRKLTTYAHKKVMEDGEEARGMSAAPVSSLVADLIRYAAYGWKAPLQDPGSRDVAVHQDAEFLSGPELVNARKRRSELVEKHPRALAIEMEGQGIFSAAHDTSVEWAVIKGISDFSDGTKSSTEVWQPFACVMAASVVANILKGPGILKDWGHYESVSQRAMSPVWISSQAIRREHERPQGNVPSEGVTIEHVPTLLDSITGGSPGQVNFKGRVIGYQAQGRVHSFKEPWVYDGTAWDVGSGINAKAKHYEKSEDAIRNAVLKVIDELKTKGVIVD